MGGHAVSPHGPWTLVHEPFHRDGCVYEEKVDGWRMLAYKDGERVRLVSRNGRDHTRRLRDIAAISKLSARALVLDGAGGYLRPAASSSASFSRASRRLTVGCPPVSLLTELDAFYTEHRRCGELEAGIDEPVVWIDCACGARIVRRV